MEKLKNKTAKITYTTTLRKYKYIPFRAFGYDIIDTELAEEIAHDLFLTYAERDEELSKLDMGYQLKGED